MVFVCVFFAAFSAGDGLYEYFFLLGLGPRFLFLFSCFGSKELGERKFTPFHCFTFYSFFFFFSLFFSRFR